MSPCRSSGTNYSGVPLTSGTWRPAGSTPTIVRALPSSVICRPRASGSAPKRRCHIPVVMTAMGAPPGGRRAPGAAAAPRRGAEAGVGRGGGLLVGGREGAREPRADAEDAEEVCRGADAADPFGRARAGERRVHVGLGGERLEGVSLRALVGEVGEGVARGGRALLRVDTHRL